MKFVSLRLARTKLWGGFEMLKTITLGSCVSVQGTFVRALSCGKILVRVGNRTFTGTPV